MPRYVEVVRDGSVHVRPQREHDLPDDVATCCHARAVVQELCKPPGLVDDNDMPQGEVVICNEDGCLVISVSFCSGRGVATRQDVMSPG